MIAGRRAAPKDVIEKIAAISQRPIKSPSVIGFEKNKFNLMKKRRTRQIQDSKIIADEVARQHGRPNEGPQDYTEPGEES